MEPHNSSRDGGTADPNTVTHEGVSAMLGELLEECDTDDINSSTLTPRGLSAMFTDTLDECAGDAISNSQQTTGVASPESSCKSLNSDPSIAPPPELNRESSSEPHLQTQRAASSAHGVSVKRDWSTVESSGYEPCEPKSKRSSSPSCVSIKSNSSKLEPPIFSDGDVSSELSFQTQTASSAALSCISMKSDRSMEHLPEFSRGDKPFNQNFQTFQRASSAAPSCVSMKSDQSMEHLPEFSKGTRSINPNFQAFQTASSAAPSCVSMKSDQSMEHLPEFSKGALSNKPNFQTFQRVSSAASSCVSMKSDHSMEHLPEFSKGAQPTVQTHRVSSAAPSCISMKSDQSMEHLPEFSRGTKPFDQKQQSTKTEVQPPTVVDGISGFQQELNQPEEDVLHRVFERHKQQMKKKCESLFEVVQTQSNKTLLNRIYTQLYIIEGESEGVNEEHEVLQMEKRPGKQRLQDTAINCNDVFKSSLNAGLEDGMKECKEIRTVMTKGIAGIGKTVSVQKFVLDWAEGEANLNVDIMFVLPFRELNLIKDGRYNLHTLLCNFHPELKDLDAKIYSMSKAVFIFDGLDESRIPMNFSQCEKVSDPTTVSSVGVLMTNLIKGELLPSALIWITSRPAAANQIPPQLIDRMTEIQGFNDPQKEEYFQKRISDHDQAIKIISHIKQAKSLYIMCHIPVFCWISATVLQKILEDTDAKDIPTTLTEMYIHFLLIQTSMKNQKYGDYKTQDLKEQLKPNRIMILKLSELAFKQLTKGNVMFYEEDLNECGIDVTEASVYSGICTQIFKEESVLYSRKVYCFVHLSFQEFLAAFYVFYCFSIQNMETLRFFKPPYQDWCDNVTLEELLEGAVRKALRSQNGGLDLFLRFLLGISLESNQRLLQGLLTHTQTSSNSINQIITYIHKQIKGEDELELERISVMMKILNMMMEKMKERRCLSIDRSINLFLCLTEMHDQSLSREIQEYLSSEKHSEKKLSPGQCAALACMLRMSEEVLEEFDLKKYNTTEEGYRRLIPAVSNCRKALLASCNLSTDLCEMLTSALQSANCPLKELDVSNNILQDTGVELLSAGLKSSNCKLQILRLAGCNLTKNSSETLSSVLKTANCTLKELDLGYNLLQDSGVELFSDGLKSFNCKLEILRLAGCNLTTKSCEILTSALQSENSSLKVLDLSDNILQDEGLEKLSAGLKSSNCKIEILRLAGCTLSISSCEILCSSLKSANTPLKELDLSNNELLDSGVEMLSAGLKSSQCELETLRLSGCLITEKGCSSLASALHSNPSYLKELDLTYNQPGDSGVKLLSSLLEDPQCKIEILRLAGCNLTEDSCKTLTLALQSENSTLKELDISTNDLQDSGVELLCPGLRSSHCKLEILRLSGSLITEKGCSSLASALRSNPSHLKELDLTYNHHGDSGVRLLSSRLEDPQCKLETLRLEHAGSIRINSGLRKYACELTLDPNTVQQDLALSEGNKKVMSVREQQEYPDHPDRFDVWLQVLCKEPMCGRCYWEAESGGRGFAVAVTYKGISRKGGGDDCRFGYNEKSWRLYCTNSAGTNSYSVWHKKKIIDIPAPAFSSSRVGMFLDWAAGILSFYLISPDTNTLTHMHTYYSKFSEPLYAGFWIGFDSSVRIG
uniref:NACHT, LRR and PYD domains-containing protein 12-like n=1 Tax=Astyanax mexicanus TaxID=7994 RepID=A0A8B9JED2_ASTMX